MDKKQLTPEELQQFQSYRKEANRLAAMLGEIHYQRTLIDLELDNLKAAIKSNVDTQQALMKSLGEIYGDGSIDINTGEITPIEAK
jgi:predicted secreted protein